MQDQKGIAQVLILLLLLGGLLSSLYLVQKTQIFKPQATSEPVTGNEASFILSIDSREVSAGQKFSVDLLVRTGSDSANLFVAKLEFPPEELEVSSIITDYFIQNWAERGFDNDEGIVSLVGGVPNPGFLTEGTLAKMATIEFIAKAKGEVSITFDEESEVYRNLDNVNILQIKKDLSIAI